MTRGAELASAARSPGASRFGVALMLLLGGPTPGAVGSCGGDDLAGFADIQSYCSEREQLICVRRELRKEIDARRARRCRREAIKAVRGAFVGAVSASRPSARRARASTRCARSTP